MKKLIHTVNRVSLPILLAILPWGAIKLLYVPTIGRPEGIWQSGVVGIYAIDVLILLTLFAWAYGHKPQLGTSVNNAWFLKSGIILFAAGVLISTLMAPVKVVALTHAIWILLGCGLAVLIWLQRNVETKIQAGLVLGGALQGICAWVQVFTQEVWASKWLGTAYHAAHILGDSVVETELRRWLRAYGLFPHPNILGIYLGIALLCGIALARNVQTKRSAYLLLVANGLIASALVLTFSRAAWLATATGFIIYILAQAKRKIRISFDITFQKVILSATALVILTTAFIFLPPTATRLGLSEYKRLETASSEQRSSALQDALPVVRGNWIVGVGLGQYIHHLADSTENQRPWYDYQPPHIMWLLILAESGILTLAGMMLVIAATTRILWTRYRQRQRGVPFQAALLVFIITASLFDHYFWSTHIGLLMWWTVLGFCLMGDGGNILRLKDGKTPVLTSPLN